MNSVRLKHFIAQLLDIVPLPILNQMVSEAKRREEEGFDYRREGQTTTETEARMIAQRLH